MDILSSADVNFFKWLVWVVPFIVAAAVFITRLKQNDYDVALAVLQSILSGIKAFVIANVGVILYILLHATDSRWSVGKRESVDIPQVDIPLLDNVDKSINDALSVVENNANAAIATTNAVETVQVFADMAFKGLLTLILAFVAIGICKWLLEKQRDRSERKANLAAREAQIKAEQKRDAEIQASKEAAERNARNLADIRMKLNLGDFQDE